MATLGQTVFYIMITLIVLFGTILILFLALIFTVYWSAESSNTYPIGNITEDVILSCYLRSDDLGAVTQMAVTWTKKDMEGVVYQYKGGSPDLGDQNSQFKGRTQLFTDLLATGNASLLLKSVRRSDAGVYTCRINSKTVNINLRTAAFSAPTFNFSSGLLSARASRWLPKPNVTWSDHDGIVLDGNTSFTENSAGIFSVFSTLQLINMSDIYTCIIENELVVAFSTATITGSDVSWSTQFTYNFASSQQASIHLNVMATVLFFYYLTV